MKPATKRRITGIAALGIAVAGMAYLAVGGIGENLVYYWDAQQLLARGKEAHDATVRLGGMVQKGSVQWKPEQLDLQFDVGMGSDPSAAHVHVKATGAPPQMFQEAMGVVVEGRYDGNVFHADRVMVKHSNEYRAPKSGERPQDMYKTLLNSDG